MQAIGKTLSVQLHEPKKVIKKTETTQIKPVTQTHSLRTLGKGLVKPDNVAAVAATKTKPLSRVKTVKKNDEKIVTDVLSKIVNVRHSLDLEKSEDNSLYVSALEDVSVDSAKKNAENVRNASVTRFLIFKKF